MVAILAVSAFAFQYVNTNQQKSSQESELKKIADVNEFRTVLNNSGSGMIVFDLYADWCGPCRMIEPVLSGLSNKYNGKVDFYRINVDENPQIAALFGANAIPHVAFVKNGKVVKTLTGVQSQVSYERIIELCAESQESCEGLLERL